MYQRDLRTNERIPRWPRNAQRIRHATFAYQLSYQEDYCGNHMFPHFLSRCLHNYGRLYELLYGTFTV
jgi:hypothetical protein